MEKELKIDMNDETASQIVLIQLRTILEYCVRKIDENYIYPEDAEKIEKMYKIINGRDKED